MDSLELRVCRQAADAGARIARKHFADLANAGIEDKASESGYQGLVTKADLEAEAAIMQTIREAFPNHSFLAEETQTEIESKSRIQDVPDTLKTNLTLTGKEQATSGTSETNAISKLAGFISQDLKSQSLPDHLWVIDPLDGTNNFAHGIPHFAISVAYYRNGIAQCGTILAPAMSDEFFCERGKGAFYNGRQIWVNGHSLLSQTMLGVGFYYDRGTMMRATLAAIGDCFEQQIHGIRRIGTAALDIVYVGLGRFGGFFEFQLAPWDFAAARLFLEEAGGKITTCRGEPLLLEKTSVLATNGKLHETMLKILEPHLNQ